MTAKNDITGDSIKSKGTSEQYRDNWDRIFGKKKDQNDTKSSETPVPESNSDGQSG